MQYVQDICKIDRITYSEKCYDIANPNGIYLHQFCKFCVLESGYIMSSGITSMEQFQLQEQQKQKKLESELEQISYELLELDN